MKAVFLIILVSISSIFAANHYVDGALSTGSNNGTSWANAWQSLADINWGSVNPGDIVYVSGDTDSTVYYGQFYIQVTGTAANLITIRNSEEAGHNGRVIIDGEDYTGSGIRIGESGENSSEYAIVKGFEVRRFQIGVHIRFKCNVITIDSCFVYDNAERGARVSGSDSPHANVNDEVGCDSITFRNSTFITPLRSSQQTDCFYLQDMSNAVIKNCFIHVQNTDSTTHIDGMQSQYLRGLKYYNNIAILDSNSFGAPFISGNVDYLYDSTIDSMIVYNNLFYMGGIWWDGNYVSGAASDWNDYFFDYDFTYPQQLFFHNTIITNGPGPKGMTADSPSYWFNNLIAQYGAGTGYSPDWLTTLAFGGYNQAHHDTMHVDSIRNNLMWTEWDDDLSVSGNVIGNGNGGTPTGFSDWVSTYGGTGASDDPLFLISVGNLPKEEYYTITGELENSSPAIYMGEDMRAIYAKMGADWVDIEGYSRPDYADSITVGAYLPQWNRQGDPPIVIGGNLDWRAGPYQYEAGSVNTPSYNNLIMKE